MLQQVTVAPGDVFGLFFNDKIIDVMVTNTNLYAHQKMATEHGSEGRNTRWKDVTAADLRIWLGITIHMGIIGLSPSHYWRCDDKLLSHDGLPTTPFMSQMRFEHIRRYFHVAPPDTASVGEQSWHSKIDPLLDQLAVSYLL